MLIWLTVASEGHWITSQLFLVPNTSPHLALSVLCRLSQGLVLEGEAYRVTNMHLHRRDEMSLVFDSTADGMQQVEATGDYRR